MRLKITIDGKGNLDLYDNTRIPVKLRNPMFHDVGSHSFSFKVPITINNKNLLQNTERVMRQKAALDNIDFKLYYNHRYLYSGRLKITSTKEKHFNCYLQIDEGALYALLKDTKINTLDDKNYVLTDQVCYDAEYNDMYDFKLGPIYNKGIVDSNGNPYNDSVFNKLQDDITALIPVTPAGNSHQPFSSYYDIPFIKLSHILDTIGNYIGATVKLPIFDRNPELYKLVIIEAYFDALAGNYKYEDIVPAYDTKSFLLDLKNLFNLFFVYDKRNNQLTLENIDFVLDDENILESPNFYIKENTRFEFHGRTLVMKKDTNDSFSNEESSIYLDGFNKITTSLGSIDNTILPVNFIVDFLPDDSPNASATKYTYSNSFEMLMPKFDIFQEDSTNIAPRLLFSRGLQPVMNRVVGTIVDDLGNNYGVNDFVQYVQDFINGYTKTPLLTQRVYDVFGTKIPDANIALTWEGEYGLINHFWKDTLYNESYRKVGVKGVAYMNEKELFFFDFFAKRIINDVKCMVTDLDFNLEANSISPIKFSAFRV